MAFSLNFHNMTSISAKAEEPLPGSEMLGRATWVNLSVNTDDGDSFVLTCFFHGEHQVGLAKAYANAINSVQPVTDETCPGHVASESDPKVCGRCGTHIDSLRPPGEQPEDLN